MLNLYAVAFHPLGKRSGPSKSCRHPHFHKHAAYILNIPTPDALPHPPHLISYDNCLEDNKLIIRKVFRLILHTVLAPSVSELSHHYRATQVGCEDQ